jgi:hypothetical protein
MIELPLFRLDIVNQSLWRRMDGADDERILLRHGVLACCAIWWSTRGGW